MCFTKTDDGQRYYQLFGILSPPRLIASDADHVALKRLCRTYFVTFAVGTLLLVPVMALVPAFWAILTAWYYDKARRFSHKTELQRPPFRLTETLRERAKTQSLASIAAGLSLWLSAGAIGLSLVLSHDLDLVLVGTLLTALSASLVWAQGVKIASKLRARERAAS